MKKRVLTQEILDHLPSDDPAAIHSRRDLRRINALMGNYRWIESSLGRLGALDGDRHIVEIGAGDGALAGWLLERHPDIVYTAIDLIPRPDHLPGRIEWRQGDVFDLLGTTGGDVLVANLILHHFDDEQMKAFGRLASVFRACVANEPARQHHAHALAWAGRVLGFNHVTRHDIHASIRAGFIGSEIPDLLGFSRWNHSCRDTLMGAHRWIATAA